MGGEFDIVLEPVVSALEADGYAVAIEREANTLVLDITAGPEACEDCLSPRAVMEPIVQHLLRQAGYDLQINIQYPVEH
jgi:hypothetical protein